MTAENSDLALRRQLDAALGRAGRIDPEHALLWETLAASTEGGKRFRPALVMAAHDALGGTRPDAAAMLGAAVELLHTAFVVHDDVIDGDDVRRGRLNVSGTFRARASARGATTAAAADYALTAGLLAGDLALAQAIRVVATCGTPPAMTHRLLDLFDLALQTTAAGELADVRLSLGLTEATLEESLRMESQKTSAYSFVLPLQVGALLADADESTLSDLGRAGDQLGVAFQLCDDLLGVFGDPRRTGKSATGDLRTQKQTPLLVHARATSQWPEIAPYLGRELSDADLETVRHLLVASGSRSFIARLAADQLASARAVLHRVGIDEDALPDLTAASILDDLRESAA